MVPSIKAGPYALVLFSISMNLGNRCFLHFIFHFSSSSERDKVEIAHLSNCWINTLLWGYVNCESSDLVLLHLCKSGTMCKTAQIPDQQIWVVSSSRSRQSWPRLYTELCWHRWWLNAAWKGGLQARTLQGCSMRLHPTNTQ